MKTTLQIPDDTWRAIRMLAIERHLPVGVVVDVILREYLERIGWQHPISDHPKPLAKVDRNAIR